MSAGGRIKYLIKYLMRVSYKALSWHRMISIYPNQPPCVLHNINISHIPHTGVSFLIPTNCGVLILYHV
jgi:hypothetical protein